MSRINGSPRNGRSAAGTCAIAESGSFLKVRLRPAFNTNGALRASKTAVLSCLPVSIRAPRLVSGASPPSSASPVNRLGAEAATATPYPVPPDWVTTPVRSMSSASSSASWSAASQRSCAQARRRCRGPRDGPGSADGCRVHAPSAREPIRDRGRGTVEHGDNRSGVGAGLHVGESAAVWQRDLEPTSGCDMMSQDGGIVCDRCRDESRVPPDEARHRSWQPRVNCCWTVRSPH